MAGLADRSRAPCHHPQEVSAELAERCLEVRRAHPTWGPVKVRAVLGGASRDALAGGEHDRRLVRPRGADGEAPAQAARAASDGAVRRLCGSQ